METINWTQIIITAIPVVGSIVCAFLAYLANKSKNECEKIKTEINNRINNIQKTEVNVNNSTNAEQYKAELERINEKLLELEKKISEPKGTETKKGIGSKTDEQGRLVAIGTGRHLE
ncbi:hypothetical protein R83H12_00653 [Fibrobacteria bacterium R8-3-H12]